MSISRKDLAISIIIAIVYLLVTVFLMNFALAKDTLFGNYPLIYKWRISFDLITGMWTSMTHRTLFLLIIVVLLSGFNLKLVFQKASLLRHAKSLRFVSGGATLLGIAGAGCASCGLPILSLLGISVSFLPFRGEGFLFIATVLLTISVYFLLKSNAQAVSCDVNLNSKRHGKIFTFNR